MRELKLRDYARYTGAPASHPTRVRELKCGEQMATGPCSRTPHGVWELKYVTRLDVACDGRAPHGVRELKWRKEDNSDHCLSVELLTGCVS